MADPINDRPDDFIRNNGERERQLDSATEGRDVLRQDRPIGLVGLNGGLTIHPRERSSDRRGCIGATHPPIPAGFLLTARVTKDRDKAIGLGEPG